MLKQAQCALLSLASRTFLFCLTRVTAARASALLSSPDPPQVAHLQPRPSGAPFLSANDIQVLPEPVSGPFPTLHFPLWSTQARSFSSAPSSDDALKPLNDRAYCLQEGVT